MTLNAGTELLVRAVLVLVFGGCWCWCGIEADCVEIDFKV
jgi:hypothetical protein